MGCDVTTALTLRGKQPKVVKNMGECVHKQKKNLNTQGTLSSQ